MFRLNNCVFVLRRCKIRTKSSTIEPSNATFCNIQIALDCSESMSDTKESSLGFSELKVRTTVAEKTLIHAR